MKAAKVSLSLCMGQLEQNVQKRPEKVYKGQNRPANAIKICEDYPS